MAKTKNLQWLEQHYEEVVRPLLKKEPTQNPLAANFKPEQSYWLDGGSSKLLVGDRLKGFYFIWAIAREKARRIKKPIFLPGRDAYLFNILAQIDGTSVIARPDISTLTSLFVGEDYSHTVMLDSGYNGTCAVNMQIPTFLLVSCRHEFRQVCRQNPLQFGGDSPANYAPMMEGIPKYWNRGEIAGFDYQETYHRYQWLKTYKYLKEPHPYFTETHNGAMDYSRSVNINKGAKFSLNVATDATILHAFAVHKQVVSDYTAGVIEAMREAARMFVDNDQEFARYLEKGIA